MSASPWFQVKLVLDMSALSLVNIPMYGILKSATTPCVMVGRRMLTPG
jgi:solute carrier family 35 protein